MSGSLFAGLFARGAVAEVVGDRAFLRAMLDVEEAFAGACVAAGLAPESAAREIAAAADEVAAADPATFGHGAGEAGTPVPAMLEALRAELTPEGPGAQLLHHGLTSQDVIDTAMMLVAKRALVVVLDDLASAATACADLVRRHRPTTQAGRTLLQHAVPITFGLKAAGWLSGIDAVGDELAEIRDRQLAAQVGGAAGTLAGLGGQGVTVAAGVARRLELAEPALPWHTQRVRPARLACGLGTACGVMAKIADDVILLAQTEVGEAHTAATGGSSAMPHKQNPVGAVAIVACGRRAPGLVATILGCMVQEHERAAGAWQAEWEPLLELMRLTGSAANALAEMLGGLKVDGERMAANLKLTGDLQGDVGAADQLIARALDAHQLRSREMRE
jgi:3-carboxy-cis,cis-muconate cycloisomerase